MNDESKQEETREEPQADEKPLDEMTLMELRMIAKDIPGVEGFSVMEKPELLTLIKKHRGMEDEATVEKLELHKPLEKMTVTELKEIAMAIPGVTGVTAMKKAELIDLIKKDRSINDEKPVEKRRKTKKSDVVPGELKKKIVQLRGEKEKAREAGDKRKIDVLRRRINRLKKRTRKAVRA
jgi:hypothetical protein